MKIKNIIGVFLVLIIMASEIYSKGQDYWVGNYRIDVRTNKFWKFDWGLLYWNKCKSYTDYCSEYKLKAFSGSLDYTNWIKLEMDSKAGNKITHIKGYFYNVQDNSFYEVPVSRNYNYKTRRYTYSIQRSFSDYYSFPPYGYYIGRFVYTLPNNPSKEYEKRYRTQFTPVKRSANTNNESMEQLPFESIIEEEQTQKAPFLNIKKEQLLLNTQQPGAYSVELFKPSGVKVRTLVSGHTEGREESISWNNAEFSSGIYLFRVIINGDTKWIKWVNNSLK